MLQASFLIMHGIYNNNKQWCEEKKKKKILSNSICNGNEPVERCKSSNHTNSKRGSHTIKHEQRVEPFEIVQ